MLLIVKDGNGDNQTLTVQSQDALVDCSGDIVADNTSQTAIPASLTRSGFYIQNRSTSWAMTVNEIGGDATVSSFELAPGQSFPPPGYPVSTSTVNVAGKAGESYTARSW